MKEQPYGKNKLVGKGVQIVKVAQFSGLVEHREGILVVTFHLYFKRESFKSQAPASDEAKVGPPVVTVKNIILFNDVSKRLMYVSRIFFGGAQAIAGKGAYVNQQAHLPKINMKLRNQGDFDHAVTGDFLIIRMRSKGLDKSLFGIIDACLDSKVGTYAPQTVVIGVEQRKVNRRTYVFVVVVKPKVYARQGVSSPQAYQMLGFGRREAA